MASMIIKGLILAAIAAIVIALICKSFIPAIRNLLNNLKPGVIVALIVVLLVIGVIIAISMFGNKGGDSLTAGDDRGNVSSDSNAGEEGYPETAGFNVDSMIETGTDGKRVLRLQIRGSRILNQGKELAEPEALFDALQEYDLTGTEIILIDDYAATTVYKDTLSKIRELGVYPTEITEK